METAIIPCTRKRCKGWWFDLYGTSGGSIWGIPQYLSCKYRVCPLRNQIAEARVIRHSALAASVGMGPEEASNREDV